MEESLGKESSVRDLTSCRYHWFLSHCWAALDKSMASYS